MDNFPRHILDSIWLGRAVLVAGQDLARGETRQLLGSEDSTASLRAALSRPPSELSDRIRAMRLAAPGPDHVEVAQAPWAFVFSSALDTRLASALEAAAPAARRVRRRFVNDVDVDSLRPSPTVLEVMHLSLMSDPTSSDGVVPDATQWSRATRLMQPHVLDHLKDVVGPAHVVIVDGISGIDSLDRDDLVAAFGGLDDRQIVLCAVHQDDTSWLLDTIPGALVYGSALAELLQRAKALAPGKVPGLLLRAEDLAITARSTDGRTTRF